MTTLHLMIVLLLLVGCSAFFSMAETAMMALNRYRLQHLLNQGNRLAQLISGMLAAPDKLLGVILIGNTFANIFASAIATLIFSRLFGELGIMLCSLALSFFILITAEIAPKILAAMHPQSVAFAVAWPLKLILRLIYPFVWISTVLANYLLKLFGVKKNNTAVDALSTEELRTLVSEAGSKISTGHQTMLLGVLELGELSVEHIMVPAAEIVGIDLSESIEKILQQLSHTEHSRLLVYDENINQVKGILHVRRLLHRLVEGTLTKQRLVSVLSPAYFIPEITSLHTQLLHFQKTKQRLALVVDEYGDIQGLITLEDILEEIVGEYTTNYAAASSDVQQQSDGSYLIDGTVTIRDLNRLLSIDLPTDGARTLSGAIIEYLEWIPTTPLCLKWQSLNIELVEIRDNVVKRVRVYR